MSGCSVAKFIRVYDDNTHTYVEVSEDPDCLGLVEIEQDGKSIVMRVEQARLVCGAIVEIAAHLEKTNEPVDNG